MSTNIFNRDDGNKVLSYAQIDNNFDQYWENEARNPVRNRIRIGRQYQAALPALLKPNEIDKYKNEERETLKWKPNNELNEQQLQQYLQLAKAVSMFSKVVTKNENSTETTTDNETGNANQQTKTTTIKNETKKDEKIDKNELNNLDVLNKFKLIFKSLSQFVNAHHPLQSNSNCKILKKNNKTDSTSNNLNVLDELNNLSNNRNWTEKEKCILITSALQVCFNNFPLIKQEFLPFKSTKNIIDYYNLCLNQDENLKTDDDKLNQIEDETKKCNELRNKLDARSADGKDTNLEQCSVILNQFINDLMKVNKNNESNIKNQTNNNEDSDNDDDKDNLNNSTNNSNTISKTNSRIINNSKTNVKNSTNNEIKDTKEHNNEKKNSKSNFKSNSDNKRSSLRTSTLNKNNQSNKLIKPINQSQTKANNNQTINKIEPKDEYEFNDQLEEIDCNSLGSLKFYKDGQLVLKLNAKQPAVNNNNKVQWEESTDSELIKLKQNLKKKKIESNKSKKSLQSKTVNDDQDDSSSFESDNEDSRTSSECSSLQNSLTNGLFNKKAKVKVENYLPLPSTKEDYLELNNNDFINKLINNEDNLKRKLPSSQRLSPKNVNLKKNKILKLNSLTNSSTQRQLIDQLNILSSLPTDLRQKLLEQNTNDIFDFQKNVNSLNILANLNNLNSLNELTNINQDQQQLHQQQNNLNFNNLLSSFNNSQISSNTFENIDSIKIRNQIECLMSNLNNLIETEQLK